MDLERIKQNFRLRSGRTKKSTKKSKQQQQTSSATEPNAKTATEQSSSAAQPDGQVATPPAPTSDTIDQDKARKPKEGERKRPDSGLGRSPKKTEDGPISIWPGDDYNIEDGEAYNKERAKIRSDNHRSDTSAKDPKIQDDDRDPEAEDFDLRPPAPRPKPSSIETMAELLFSSGHLDTLIHHPALLTKFTTFLQKYRPQDHPLLIRYLETSKAIKAVEYANAVAESAPASSQFTEGDDTDTSNIAAKFDPSFRKSHSSTFDTMLNTSLPTYVTYTLIRTISECLINEITGHGSPHVHDIIGGLSEVFCLTDPTQEDDPIIYASEEFYRLTGYGRDDVIGHNCRFLQGPKTNRSSPRRLRASLDRDEEIYETLLNYRRDGRPFVNLLMIAPLYDNKGNIKYHLGAQVDVSRLIESGKVLEGFQRYLDRREVEKQRKAMETARNGADGNGKKRKALQKLRELSELFDLEESAVVQSHSRSASLDRERETRGSGSGGVRRRLIDSEASDDDDDDENDWKLGRVGPSGLSGKLPGIYEKYMLIRPAPSLRVVFVSPKLSRIGNVMQSPFLSHLAAPPTTLEGLTESFESGIPVSARINFMSESTNQRDGTRIPPNERHEDGKYGRACWMSATPLLGADDRIGVWMIVFVEKTQTRALRARRKMTSDVSLTDRIAQQPKPTKRAEALPKQPVSKPTSVNRKVDTVKKSYDLPIKPKRLDEAQPTARPSHERSTGSAYQYRAASPVEEYHSEGEEKAYRSPGKRAPRVYIPPRDTTYDQSDDDDDDDDNDFVQSTPVALNRAPSQRVLIEPDSDGEAEPAGATTSRSRLDLTKEFEDEGEDENGFENDEDVFVDPNDIPPSIPSDHEPVLDDGDHDISPVTPERSKSRERENNIGSYSLETVRLQNASSEGMEEEYQEIRTARNSAALPGGTGYMDYWRHPGSNQKASGDLTRGRRRTRDAEGAEVLSDPDCARTPYSVD